MAHEINNPSAIILTRIGMLLEEARENGFPPDHIEALEVIERQTRRIARITGDLLVFSRMTPMAREPVDVSSLLRWACTTHAARAKAIGVTMKGDIPPDVFALGDPGGLEQVFDNLIKNALDAMEETGGTLLRSIEVDGDRVRVRIEDTGPGISPEVLPHVFDPFFTTKRVGKGTGLGLAISYGILQELEGEITVENREEGGASFSVILRAAGGAARPSPGHMPGWEGVTL